ncbi:MAG: nucleoside monophosphate kinase [bacterium]|nr:nucleoside monophosphate kinase [bacterium]
MEILVITGPPYSGKGTQCEIIKEHLGYKHISTGDRCRHEKEVQSDIGKVMSEYEERGDLVPDSIMKELFNRILDENKSETGIVLDGYPRTIPQVDDLFELLETKDMEIGKVLNIEVPRSELLMRAENRAKTSDRKDDKDPATHLKRINIFEESTLPAIEYFKSKVNVITFNGLGSIEEISNKILSTL